MRTAVNAHLQGSYQCGACTRGFFLASDGVCIACPAVTSLWDRYSTLILLIVSVIGFAVFMFAFLSAVIVAGGGSMTGLGMVREGPVTQGGKSVAFFRTHASICSTPFDWLCIFLRCSR